MKDIIPTIITGDLLASYLPKTLTVEEKTRAITLAADLRKAITQLLPIGFYYDGKPRIGIPASLYLQEDTLPQKILIPDPTRRNSKKRILRTEGARRAIGFDILQVLDRETSLEQWKSFHVDQVNNLRLLTIGEIERIFPGLNDDDYMSTPTEPPEGHVKNWNYWFRSFIIERSDSLYDVRVPETFYRENLQSEEK